MSCYTGSGFLWPLFSGTVPDPQGPSSERPREASPSSGCLVVWTTDHREVAVMVPGVGGGGRDLAINKHRFVKVHYKT